MRENFSRAVDFVIRQEVRPGHEQDGDLHTDPKDLGGTTCFGFAQRFQKFNVATLQNNRLLAEQKFDELYWTPAGCDSLAWPVDIIHFDTSVNMGQGVAASLLSASGGKAVQYIWLRMKAYWDRRSSPNFPDWIKRLVDLHLEINQ
jgi:lysozyme family protein